jgi:hypothetical protein
MVYDYNKYKKNGSFFEFWAGEEKRRRKKRKGKKKEKL